VPPFQLHLLDTIRRGENDLIIHDSYTAMGQKYVYDALHSFNRRKLDHFGGLLNEKINAGLAEVRSKGFPSDLKKLIIQIDPSTLTVYWTAVVGPSEDGKCYMQVDSRGSAGGGLKAVEKQFPRMHSLHKGLVPAQLLEFNENVLQCYDWDGNKLDSVYNTINIRQHFFKYYDPKAGTPELLAEKATTNTGQVTAPAVQAAPQKKTAPVVSHKKYTVKQGDTLSEIAEKYHTSIAKIKQLNGLRSDAIRVGQTLKVP
jgi:LysM repeat protein